MEITPQLHSGNLSVLLLAAGKGTRFCSHKPKVLHRLCGLSLLERTLRAIAPLQPQEVVIVVGHGRAEVEAEIQRIAANSTLNIACAVQSEQKGTGHAAQVGLAKLSNSCQQVLVLPADVPLLTSQVLETFLKSSQKRAPVNVLSCRHPQPFGFGRVIRDLSGEVQAIVEERDCSPAQREIAEINTSIYLVQASFLRSALEKLQPTNAQSELYLTDIVAQARVEGFHVLASVTNEVDAVTGANSRLELSELERLRRRELVNELMEQGVSFEDPATVYLEEDVQIGRDTFVGANTRIKRGTRIGENVVIEGDSLIADSIIANGVFLRLGSYLDQAEVGEKTSVGPYAQLRPGTVLGKSVRIGNFVEVKNSSLADEVKANHLAYIGDAAVGAQSNIGAGTIFCNYDGQKKNRCNLGEKVFVGSNSVLVAPISLGDESYVGAGSAITKDVPAKSLAVGRGRQTNIEGWVEKQRPKKHKAIDNS